MSEPFEEDFREAKAVKLEGERQLKFTEVLAHLALGGGRFARANWQPGFYISIYHPSSSMNKPYLFMQEPPANPSLPHETGPRYPWTPDQSDLFADDWMTYEEHNKEELAAQKEKEAVEMAAGLGGGLGNEEDDDPGASLINTLFGPKFKKATKAEKKPVWESQAWK